MRLQHWLLTVCGLVFLSVVPAAAQDDLDPQCVDAGYTTYDDCAAYLQSLSAPAEEPVAEQPVPENQPIYEDPAPEEPVAEEPVYQEPVAEEPVAEEPVAEEPVAEQPQADNVDQQCLDAGYTTFADCDNYLQSLNAPAEPEQSEAEPVQQDDPVAEEPTAQDQPTDEQPVADQPAQDNVAQECLDNGYTTTAECDTYLAQQNTPTDETATDQPTTDEPTAPDNVAQECLDNGYTTTAECDTYLAQQNTPIDQTTTDQPTTEPVDPDQPVTTEEATTPTTDEPVTPDAVAQQCIDAGYTTTAECNTYLQDQNTPANETATDQPVDPEQPVTTEEATTPATALSQDCIDAGFTTTDECAANQPTPQTVDETTDPNAAPQNPPDDLIAQPEVDPYADTQPEDLTIASEPVAEDDPNAKPAPLTDAAKENPDAVIDESVPVITEATLPPDDEAASVAATVTPEEIVAASHENVEKLDAAPAFTPPDNVTIINQTNVTNNTTNTTTNITNTTVENNTYVYEVNNTYVINNSVADRDRIFGDDTNYQFDQIGDNRFRETVYREDGSQVVTVRDQYGNILERYRTDPYGETYVFAYFDPSYYNDLQYWSDPGDSLPVLRLNISLRDYVMDWYYADEDQISVFFRQPPVEHVRRVYSIDEVKRSARLRDSVRRLEVGNLNFASGESRLSRNQINGLKKLADAMLSLLADNPAETFLIEGHTDAPGSDQSNLVLSDQRAAAVARILTHYYGIPPENLATQGYGERYLRVRTKGDEPQNRRVTIRRITPLISPYFASN